MSSETGIDKFGEETIERLMRRVMDGPHGPVGLVLGRHDLPVTIFDRPEQGRHLRGQMEMAGRIAREVTARNRVFVVTYSDTLLQSINVLIQLGSIGEKPERNALMEQWGLKPDMTLDRANAHGFQIVDGAMERLKLTELGFVCTDINQAIADLTQRVIALDALFDRD